MLGLGKGSVISLDVGFHSIKVLEVAMGKKQIEAKRLLIVPTGNTPNMPEEEREERTGNLLQAIWKEHGLKNRRVRSVIPGRAVFYRPLRIPVVTGERLEKIVRYEARQQIPFSLDQILIDYHIFGGTGGELEGTLIAARRDTVNEHVRMLARGGLLPEVIDVSWLSLFNSTRDIPRESDEVIAVVNIGARTTDIVIEHEHVLKFMRSAPVGGNDLSQALQSALDLSFEESEELKVRSGHLSTGQSTSGGSMGGFDEESITGTLDGAFDRVVTEIRRSIDYYISQPEGMAVSRLVITGGGANLPGTEEFLEERLGIPVEKFNILEHCTEDISNVVSEEEAPFVMGVAGLSLPPAEGRGISMNFIPETIQQKKEFEKRRGYIVLQGVFLAILVGIIYAYLQKYLQFKQSVHKTISGVVRVEAGAIGAELKEARELQDQMQERFEMLEQISLSRGKVMENLLEVVRITPTNYISINQVKIDRDTMLIQGDASDDRGVKSFMQELRLSPFIAEMRNVTDKSASGAFKFDIRKLHEPTEDENLFYSRLSEVRREVPALRLFLFGNKRFPDTMFFNFYETLPPDEVYDQMETVLRVFVDCEIEFKDVILTLWSLREKRIGGYKTDKENIMKIYHGEADLQQLWEEAERQRELENQKKEAQQGA